MGAADDGVEGTGTGSYVVCRGTALTGAPPNPAVGVGASGGGCVASWGADVDAGAKSARGSTGSGTAGRGAPAGAIAP